MRFAPGALFVSFVPFLVNLLVVSGVEGSIPKVDHLSEQGVRLGGLRGGLGLHQGDRKVVVMVAEQCILGDFVLARYGAKRLPAGCRRSAKSSAPRPARSSVAT